MSYLFKRGSTYWGRVRIAGNELRRSLRTSNKAEAQRKIDKWEKELKGVMFHERYPYKDAAGRWLIEYLPSAIKPSSAKRYQVSMRQLDTSFGDKMLHEVDRKAIAGFVSKRKKTATNKTIKRDLSALSSIFKCAISWGWCDTNPALEYLNLRVLKEKRIVITPPSDEDVKKLADELSDMLSRLVWFLRYTGMRLDEATSLKWSQVDLDNNEVILYHTKTNRPRVVPLDDRAGGTIRGTPRNIKHPYVFWHGDGQRYAEPSSYLAKVKKKHNLLFRIHDLRHAFAIEYLKKGGDIYALSRILGHTSVKTTEIYLGYAGAQTGAQDQRITAKVESI